MRSDASTGSNLSSAGSKSSDRVDETAESIQSMSVNEDGAKPVKTSAAKKRFGKMARLVGVIQTAQKMEVSFFEV